MSARNNNLSSFEALESRELRSATPFTGTFGGDTNGAAVQVSLNQRGSKCSGTVTQDGQTFNLSGKIKSNRLTGTMTDASTGQRESVSARLSGTNLNVVANGQNTMTSKFTGRSGNAFTASTPSNWTMQDGQNGVVIESPDGSIRLSESATEVSGYVTADDIVQAAENQGSNVLGAQVTSDTVVNGVEQEQEVVVLTFNDQNGNTFATGLLINTATDGNNTIVQLTSMTAPAAQFSNDVSMLSKMLGNVNYNGGGQGKGHTRDWYDDSSWGDDYSNYDFGGFYDPGVEGDWSYSGGMDYSTNPWLYDEQSSLAYSSASFDQETSNFDDYLLS